LASLDSPSLRRRLDALTEAVRRRVEHREEMREKAKACAAIRAALAEAGVDPAQNGGFRYFEYAERIVPDWPDTPELQRADTAFIAQDPKLASRESLAAQAASRTAQFVGQPLPDPRTMSAMDWYAWALAARSATTPDDPR
jgi:hypothetical protein